MAKLRRTTIKGFKRGRGRGRGKDDRDQGYRINAEVRAPEVRLIGADGKLLGNYSSREAFQMATDQGLDLIEIAPNAKPPTCKIMDYGKWKYENKKKAVAAKKKQNIINVKEIQVRPRTEKHDMETKVKHARRFLLDGDKVKVNLRFSGREMAHQDIGVKVLEGVTKMLDDLANVEAPPKREGRQMFVLMSPDPAKIKEYQKAQKSAETESSSGEEPQEGAQ